MKGAMIDIYQWIYSILVKKTFTQLLFITAKKIILACSFLEPFNHIWGTSIFYIFSSLESWQLRHIK